MVKYGLDYTRCRWILPLLLGLAMIFGIISLAGWGWVTSQSWPYSARSSLWRLCYSDDDGLCRSLTDYAWGRAASLTFLLAFILVVICFALAIIAFAIPTLRFNFIRGIGGLLFVAAAFGICGLVIYPVKMAQLVPADGMLQLGWAYGFGWTMTLMAIGLGFFFCCLPLYEDHILGNVKPYMIA
uniref:P53 apoptosis effector related to PMP-22 n=1 Tax=Salvator merianae TaxID=96440 RepID=A0A8D0B1A2_SALMN